MMNYLESNYNLMFENMKFPDGSSFRRNFVLRLYELPPELKTDDCVGFGKLIYDNSTKYYNSENQDENFSDDAFVDSRGMLNCYERSSRSYYKFDKDSFDSVSGYLDNLFADNGFYDNSDRNGVSIGYAGFDPEILDRRLDKAMLINDVSCSRKFLEDMRGERILLENHWDDVAFDSVESQFNMMKDIELGARAVSLNRENDLDETMNACDELLDDEYLDGKYDEADYDCYDDGLSL